MTIKMGVGVGRLVMMKGIDRDCCRFSLDR